MPLRCGCLVPAFDRFPLWEDLSRLRQQRQGCFEADRLAAELGGFEDLDDLCGNPRLKSAGITPTLSPSSLRFVNLRGESIYPN